MATTINVTLNDLVLLRQRIESRTLAEGDWAIVCALISKRIAQAEARQERLRAKANAQAQESETEPANQMPTDAQGAAQSTTNGRSTPLSTSQEATAADTPASAGTTDDGKPRPKGHGRNGAAAFTGAKDERHPLPDGVIGSLCKACRCSPVSPYRDLVIVRVTGQPSFGATRHGFEQGHCRRCGAIVTAEGTEEVLQGIGTRYVTYDWLACAMLLVLHYFAGLPFKRIESLQKGWGIPMPDANQWRVADESDDLLSPLYKKLESHGTRNATGLRIDDTGSMIIEVRQEIRKEIDGLVALGESARNVRTGINATGVYLDTEEGKTVLFFTGRHHAGEIIDKLLAHRKAKAEKLVTVTDAASKNFDHDQGEKLEQAVCNAHCYLKFRAIKDKFPAEYTVAAEVYAEVFDNDDRAHDLGLNPQERMRYHQSHSLPLMQRLYDMCKEKADGKLVEPNSSLWEPIAFVINQWARLAKFCSVPGVPLDSNLVEQTLIIPVRYLAGSFAYKTQNGADVGDRHMSLIATANANGVEAVAYLAECLRNHEDLARRPEYYLPWVYRDRLQKCGAPETAAVMPRTAVQKERSTEHPLRPGTHRPNPQPPPTEALADLPCRAAS